MTLSSWVCIANNIELGYFKSADLPNGQSGCWYYYPVKQGNKPGNIIAVGNAASDSLDVSLFIQ